MYILSILSQHHWDFTQSVDTDAPLISLSSPNSFIAFANLLSSFRASEPTLRHARKLGYILSLEDITGQRGKIQLS